MIAPHAILNKRDRDKIQKMLIGHFILLKCLKSVATVTFFQLVLTYLMIQIVKHPNSQYLMEESAVDLIKKVYQIPGFIENIENNCVN